MTLFFILNEKAEDFLDCNRPTRLFCARARCPPGTLCLCGRAAACQSFLTGAHPYYTLVTQPNTPHQKQLNNCALVCAADWCLGKPVQRHLGPRPPNATTHNAHIGPMHIGPDRTAIGAISRDHSFDSPLQPCPARSFLPLRTGASAAAHFFLAAALLHSGYR